jgi:Secretion system C-terminal sorting domain
MKSRKILSGIFVGILFVNGLCFGQARIGFTNANGFPLVVSQGSHHDLSGWLLNNGNAVFSGNLDIQLRADSQTTVTLDNNFGVTNLQPGDSVYWTRTNYTFPPGHFRTGNNDVLIWPTNPSLGTDVDFDSTTASIYFAENAAFRLVESDFGSYSAGMSLGGNYDLVARGINLSESPNADDVCLFAMVPGKQPICLDRDSRIFAQNEVAEFSIHHFKPWDAFDIHPADTAGGIINQITFFVLETNTSLDPYNKVVLPLDRITATVNPTDAANVKIYPNPFQTGFQIEVPEAWRKDAVVQVSDLSGRIVHESALQAGTLNLAHLSDGSYLLQIQSPKGTYRQQIIRN